jgi:hypothetical protein
VFNWRGPKDFDRRTGRFGVKDMAVNVWLASKVCGLTALQVEERIAIPPAKEMNLLWSESFGGCPLGWPVEPTSLTLNIIEIRRTVKQYQQASNLWLF